MTTDDVSHRLRNSLRLHNTLTGVEDVFSPIDVDHVRMYGCGPTVYSTPHIGNMRMYVTLDLIQRVLRFAGYRLETAMNITDVGHLTSDADSGDDKLVAAARAERMTAWEVAGKYTDEFFDYARRLNIQPMNHVLRATDHIPEQIDLIRRLDDKGVVYRVEDGIYFDTSKVSDYGKLTPNDTRGQLRSGQRVPLGDKRHPTDFALWKFSAPGAAKRDMEWSSPWGVGFPGWHIECSAMAMAYLGDSIDVHVGGIDHIAIHHTNEIAQSETATGKPFSRWWMHGAFLILDGEKRMGKSEGNRITLDDLVDAGFDPLEFRYLLLMSHYRSPLSFSMPTLAAAASAYRRLRRRIAAIRSEAAGQPLPEVTVETPQLRQFVDAIADDVNTPRALAALWNLVRDRQADAPTTMAAIHEFDRVLGLDLANAVIERIPADIAELAKHRWRLRAAGDYAGADGVRTRLANKGYEVRDSRDGYEVIAT